MPKRLNKMLGKIWLWLHFCIPFAIPNYFMYCILLAKYRCIIDIKSLLCWFKPQKNNKEQYFQVTSIVKTFLRHIMHSWFLLLCKSQCLKQANWSVSTKNYSLMVSMTVKLVFFVCFIEENPAFTLFTRRGRAFCTCRYNGFQYIYKIQVIATPHALYIRIIVFQDLLSL